MQLPRRFYLASVFLLTAVVLLSLGPPPTVARSQTSAPGTASNPAAPLQGPVLQGAPSAGRPLVNPAAHFDVSPPLRALAAARPAPSAAIGPARTMPLGRRPVGSPRGPEGAPRPGPA